jgi:hypothetical protein
MHTACHDYDLWHPAVRAVPSTIHTIFISVADTIFTARTFAARAAPIGIVSIPIITNLAAIYHAITAVLSEAVCATAVPRYCITVITIFSNIQNPIPADLQPTCDAAAISRYVITIITTFRNIYNTIATVFHNAIGATAIP